MIPGKDENTKLKTEFPGNGETDTFLASKQTQHNLSRSVNSEKGFMKDIFIVAFYKRLSNAFSWRFVLFVSFVYGINQGLGESWITLACTFYFSDPVPKGLDLPEERVQKISGFANVPWEVKSIYGIISDNFPVFGYRRIPYIFFAGILGLFSFIGLSVYSNSIFMIAIFLFFGNLSMASPDVMIDASVAEKCRDQPEFASDLQSLCWGSFAMGAIFAYGTGGYLYDEFSSQGLFALCVISALVLIYPAFSNWLGDQDMSTSTEDFWIKQRQRTFCGKVQNILNEKKKKAIIKLSFAILGISFTLGLLGGADLETSLFELASFITVVSVVYLIYHYEYSISPILAKASIYIFLGNALQPSSVVLTYWLRDVYPHCHENLVFDPVAGKNISVPADFTKSPCFSADFISNLSVVGYVCFLLGTVVYNKYFSSWPYRRIYTFTQICLFLAGMLDLVLVTRVNLALGIPDYVFVIGDEVIGDVIGRLNTMPLFILAAGVCPPGIEATLFSFNMGLSNFGSVLASYFGLGLLRLLGTSHKTGFHNLGLYIFVRTCFKLLPLALIPFLIPDKSPSDSFLENSKDEGSSTDSFTDKLGEDSEATEIE
eukprot:snap_masked-scaffold_13-processed-gene-8.40-mRNA-1 protein AED:0.11 eAED:0.12 QI:0/0/0/1/1/1/2/0/599